MLVHIEHLAHHLFIKAYSQSNINFITTIV